MALVTNTKLSSAEPGVHSWLQLALMVSAAVSKIHVFETLGNSDTRSLCNRTMTPDVCGAYGK
jgi:hypothetical protein